MRQAMAFHRSATVVSYGTAEIPYVGKLVYVAQGMWSGVGRRFRGKLSPVSHLSTPTQNNTIIHRCESARWSTHA